MDRCGLTKEQAEELSELLYVGEPRVRPSQHDEQKKKSPEVAGIILLLEG